MRANSAGSRTMLSPSQRNTRLMDLFHFAASSMSSFTLSNGLTSNLVNLYVRQNEHRLWEQP